MRTMVQDADSDYDTTMARISRKTTGRQRNELTPYGARLRVAMR
jgi:hypothetical protein